MWHGPNRRRRQGPGKERAIYFPSVHIFLSQKHPKMSWQQFSARSFVGQLHGREVQETPAQMLLWKNNKHLYLTFDVKRQILSKIKVCHFFWNEALPN